MSCAVPRGLIADAAPSHAVLLAPAQGSFLFPEGGIPAGAGVHSKPGAL